MDKLADAAKGFFWIFIVICVICAVTRLLGYGVDDDEVICDKGGHAYLPMMNRLYQVPAKDAACKKKE